METQAAQKAFDKFVSWYTSEKQFSAISWDNLEEVQLRLKENLEPAFQLRQLNPFASFPPFRGRIWNSGGLIPYSVRPFRNLSFILSETSSGTRLDGTLELRARRYAIIVPAVYVCFVLFGAITGSIPFNGLPQLILGSVRIFLFVRLNLMVSTWFSRRGEAKFLEWVDRAIQPAKIPSPSAPASQSASAPTPTEVFFQPRRSVDR